MNWRGGVSRGGQKNWCVDWEMRAKKWLGAKWGGALWEKLGPPGRVCSSNHC